MIKAGNYQAKAVKVELGLDKKDRASFRVNFQIVGGEFNGQNVQYSGLFTDKATRYTKHAMLALGWKGVTSATAVDDVTKAEKTVPIEVEIASWEGREWPSVRNVGESLAAPLKPLNSGDLKDVDKWLAQAGGDDIPF